VGRSGLFVAMFSFPRTVLSLKQSTEPTQVHFRVNRGIGSFSVVWSGGVEAS
jgi:hypothetical protein